MSFRNGYLIACAALLILAAVSAGCSSAGPAAPAEPAASPAPATSGTAAAVTIQNFAFSPATITVKPGTTVTWTNQDSASHTIMSDGTPAAFSSGTLANGATYQFTFTSPGTYPYHCTIHPSMTGTVVVQG